MVDTTIPRDATADAGNQVPGWALVLLWSFEEPHRTGEVAFLPSFERRFVGRGDDDIDEFAHFGQQRSGEPLPRPSREGVLAGIGMSRRQLVVRATAVGVEMEQVGRATTFVNGEKKTRATLREGDTILVQGAALRVTVRSI